MSTTENKAYMPMQPAPVERWRERLRLASVGVLAGLVVGLMAGVVARLMMRLIALKIGSMPVFTLATLNLLGVGLSRGSVAGLLLVAIRKYLPGNILMKGLAFGVLLLLLFALLFLLPPPGELLAAPLFGGVLFTLLCLLAGIALVTMVARLEHALPVPRLRLLSIVGYGFLMLLGACSVLLVLTNDVAPLLTGLLR
ncbi:MAG: hypothetical protein NVS4B9_37130 [Ktedonobacteraceae bacterium]